MEQLKQVINELDQLKAELDSLRPINVDALHQLNQKLRLEWNYHSNSIEGNSLTLSETKSFILFGVTAKGKPFRDYLEMKGHNAAIKKLESIVSSDLKITENLIKEFHRIILVEPYADSKAEINPGNYKTRHNYLYSVTNERIDFAHPMDVPVLVNELINWLANQISPPKRKKNKYHLHPLLIAAQFHVRFVKIHPFGDGNGRIARIFTNLILMLTGYTPAIIKTDFRQDYYLSLDQGKNAEGFSIFLGNACIESMKLAIKAAKGETLEESEDWQKEVELLNRQVIAKAKKEQREESELSVLRIKWIEKNLPRILESFDKTFFPFYESAERYYFSVISNNKKGASVERLDNLFILSYIEEQRNVTNIKIITIRFDFWGPKGLRDNFHHYFEIFIEFYLDEVRFKGTKVAKTMGPDLVVIEEMPYSYEIFKMNLTQEIGDLRFVKEAGKRLVQKIQEATS